MRNPMKSFFLNYSQKKHNQNQTWNILYLISEVTPNVNIILDFCFNITVDFILGNFFFPIVDVIGWKENIILKSEFENL